jgi:hypothetical protein
MMCGGFSEDAAGKKEWRILVLKHTVTGRVLQLSQVTFPASRNETMSNRFRRRNALGGSAVDPAPRQAYLIGMSNTLPTATPRRSIWPLAAVSAVLGVLLAVAGALWVYYGTAVFFEIVRAGIAACF